MPIPSIFGHLPYYLYSAAKIQVLLVLSNFASIHSLGAALELF